MFSGSTQCGERVSVDALLVTDPGTVPNAALLGVLRDCETARRQLDAAYLALVAEVEARAVAVEAGATSTVGWLRAETGATSGAAKRSVTTATRLAGRYLLTGAALAAGELSVEHAHVIRRGLDRLTRAVDAGACPGELVAEAEQLLIERAGECDPDELADWAAAILNAADPDAADATAAKREERAHRERSVVVVAAVRWRRRDAERQPRRAELRRAQGRARPARRARPGRRGHRDERPADQRRHDALAELLRRALATARSRSPAGTAPRSPSPSPPPPSSSACAPPAATASTPGPQPATPRCAATTRP
jgi:hypothetical protein